MMCAAPSGPYSSTNGREKSVNTLAAIWHHPGAQPTRAGAGDYPVVIVDVIQAPAGPLALVVDSTGRFNTAPTGELEVVDASVSEAIARAQERLRR
jgi:hypothetical protein